MTNELLRLKTIQVAQNLLKLGYTTGDNFTIIARNSHFVAPILFAAYCLGCPINPLDPSFNQMELMHMLKIVQPKVVFCDVDRYELVHACLKELNNAAAVYTFGGRKGEAKSIMELLVETRDEHNFR